MTLCINPDIQFTDNVVGAPLYQGTLYFGIPNQDPKTNPKQPFSNPGLSIPISATQPLTDAGKPAQSIYLDGDYALLVEDQYGAQVKLIPSLGTDDIDNLLALLAGSGGADLIGYGAETVADALDRLTAPSFVIFSTGQSNMPQAVAYSWTPPPNLYLWNFDGNTQNSNEVGTAFVPASGTSMGPSVVAASELARENPGASVYVINVYRGGLGMVNWGPSPPDYDFREAISGNVPAALAAIGASRIDYFIWGGGESDANAQSQTIAVDFETWIMTWLKTNSWFEPWTPTYILDLPPYAQSSPGNLDYLWRRYGKAFLACTWPDPTCRAFISKEDMPLDLFDATGAIPYIHHTAEGYYELGKKIGRTMITGVHEVQGSSSLQGFGTVSPAPTASNLLNCSDVTIGLCTWTRVFNDITVTMTGTATVTADAAETSFWVPVPIKAKQFPNNVGGNLTSYTRGNAGIVLAVASQQVVKPTWVSTGTGVISWHAVYTYRVNSSDVLPNSPPGTT